MNFDPSNPPPAPQDPLTPFLPPPIAPNNAAWPPAPGGQAPPPVWLPFRFVYERLDGYLSDMREGAIAANASGIYLSGKAQPRAEIYQPIVFGLALVNLLIGLVAHFILRYACLQPVNLYVPWQHVRRIVTVSKKRKFCMVYDAPNYLGAPKTFCLALSLSQEDFDAFVATAAEYAPDRTTEGKLKPGSSFIFRFFVGLFALVMLLGLIAVIMNMIHPTSSGGGTGGASILLMNFMELLG